VSLSQTTYTQVQYLDEYRRNFYEANYGDRLVLHDALFIVALWNRAGHYIFILWFLLPFFFPFSSPNLSGRRLDVYTHGVALVQI